MKKKFMFFLENTCSPKVLMHSTFIDNSKELLFYIVYKYSKQDWAIYCLRYKTIKNMYLEEAHKFIADTGTKLTITQNIKRVFNCSKKVLDLYTY